VTDAELRDIVDRLEIQELMHRYAAMVDRREWAEQSRVFTPDAHIDYTSTGGTKGPCGEVLEWLARALTPWPLNLHFISNLVIELEGDTARASCYFNAPMGRVEEDGSQLIITNAGHYDDELARTPEGWRIAARVCRQTMMLGRLPEGYRIPD
jgi:3-phenylpropionate/cinnamic acid dioxygenase small subunit